MVWDHYQRGEIEAIRNYCETDVMNTWLVYLRFQYLRGQLDAPGLDEEYVRVRRLLDASDAPHWKAFREAWVQTDSAAAAAAVCRWLTGLVASNSPAETAEVLDLTLEGAGVLASPGGKRVLVPGALAGEQISFRRQRRRRNFDEGVLLEVLRPSPRARRSCLRILFALWRLFTAAPASPLPSWP